MNDFNKNIVQRQRSFAGGECDTGLIFSRNRESLDVAFHMYVSYEYESYRPRSCGKLTRNETV